MRHQWKLGVCFALLMALILLWLSVGKARAENHSPAVANNSAAVAEVNARDDLYTLGSEQQDPKILSSVWADSFIDTNGTGVVRNKQQMLAAIIAAKKTGQKTISISISDRRTQVYGNAAVVTGMYTTRVMDGGKPQIAKGRFTDVWVKQHNSWICVAAHSSPLK